VFPTLPSLTQLAIRYRELVGRCYPSFTTYRLYTSTSVPNFNSVQSKFVQTENSLLEVHS